VGRASIVAVTFSRYRVRGARPRLRHRRRGRCRTRRDGAPPALPG